MKWIGLRNTKSELLELTTLNYSQEKSVIKNFDEIKSQLKELSEVVNSFKSEAVQLRIVDLVLGTEPASADENADEIKSPPAHRLSRRKTSTAKKTTAKPTAKRAGVKPSGQGAVATLGKLVEDGFFAKPKSIGDIVKHCEHNLARKFKANEFSGKLGKLVREGALKRTKNAENQYEYQGK